MREIISAMKERWATELSTVYGGELEVNYIDGNYYACAFHDESRDGYDSWIEYIREFECLGNNEDIELECHILGIPVCH